MSSVCACLRARVLVDGRVVCVAAACTPCYCHRDGITTARACVRACVQVRAAGGASFVQARVDGLLMRGGRCTGVTVGKTEIHAPCVVNSIGALPSYEMLRPHFPR